METNLKTNSAKETENLGQKIGSRLRGSEVIELSSDVGGGKTTFVRGLARGMGSDDLVSSPSFTVKNVYKCGKLELHHFDFYRLEESGITGHELEEVVDDNKIVVVLEWAGVAEAKLPKSRIIIKIIPSGDDGRDFEIICPEKLKYLVENL